MPILILPPPQQPWLTSEQTAQALGISRRTALNWARRGWFDEIPPRTFPYAKVAAVAQELGLEWAQPPANGGR